MPPAAVTRRLFLPGRSAAWSSGAAHGPPGLPSGRAARPQEGDRSPSACEISGGPETAGRKSQNSPYAGGTDGRRARNDGPRVAPPADRGGWLPAPASRLCAALCVSVTLDPPSYPRPVPFARAGVAAAARVTRVVCALPGAREGAAPGRHSQRAARRATVLPGASRARAARARNLAAPHGAAVPLPAEVPSWAALSAEALRPIAGRRGQTGQTARSGHELGAARRGPAAELPGARLCRVTCRCPRRAGTIRAVAGVCLVCGGLVLPAVTPHHAHPPGAVQIATVPADRLDWPHPPDRDAAQPARADTVAVGGTAGALTLDHPDLGRLDFNPLG